MKHYSLLNNERAGLVGFTDLFIVNHEDLTESVNGTAQAIDLLALTAEDVVLRQSMAIQRVGLTDLSEISLEVGHSGSTAKYLQKTNFVGTSTFVANDSVINEAFAAVTVEALFSPAVGENLADETTFECAILMAILRGDAIDKVQA